jgi:hypothetical protein
MEQLTIPVLILNNTSIMASKKNITQQYITIQPSRKSLKISKYEKIESVLLGWFRLKPTLNIPIQDDPLLHKKPEES